jgi:hypothetical protein
MAKRIYTETVKKWAIGAGIATTGSIIFLIFNYLLSMGYISDDGHSGDSFCNATSWDNPADILCEAYLNFTVLKEDLFIYPVDYDPYGRNTPFEFNPAVKDWKLYRSWGKGWRLLNLSKGCTGTWCGGKRGVKNNVFSVAFRKGKQYQIKAVAIKQNPEDTIKWSFGTVDPFWFGINKICDFEVKRTYKTNPIYVSSVAPNGSIIEIQTGTEIEIINETTCNVVGFKIGKKMLNFSECNIKCKRSGTEILCVYCEDGDCITNHPFDYMKKKINSGGWSGFYFDVKKTDWSKLNKKIDSKEYKELKECILYDTKI